MSFSIRKNHTFAQQKPTQTSCNKRYESLEFRVSNNLEQIIIR